MIAQKTKYALKALMVLADEKAEARAPKRLLEHILLGLKRAGLIGSRRGRNGGYERIKDPARVSLAEVLRQIDGPLAPLPCLSRRAAPISAATIAPTRKPAACAPSSRGSTRPIS